MPRHFYKSHLHARIVASRRHGKRLALRQVGSATDNQGATLPNEKSESWVSRILTNRNRAESENPA